MSQNNKSIFGESLSNFFKVRAKEAFQFGEGLVKSITQKERQAARQKAVTEGPQSSEKKKPLINTQSDDNSTVLDDRGVAKRFTLKDYYDSGPTTPKKDLAESFHAENLDTQVMNIEADFDQLDIGEEPIFERHAIKQTSMNIFKDKMTHL